MVDWRSDRIGSALRGENPTVLTRVPTGFVVIGDTQFLPGYRVLLADDGTADRLADLPRAAAWHSWPTWTWSAKRSTASVHGETPASDG